jgi:hypothetical protein
VRADPDYPAVVVDGGLLRWIVQQAHDCRRLGRLLCYPEM